MRAARLLACSILMALLAACGGGGAGSGATAGTSNPGTEASPSEPGRNDGVADTGGAGANKLFVSEFSRGKVAMFSDLVPAQFHDTWTVPTLDVAGAGALAYDSDRDLLYAASGSRILVYAGASAMSSRTLPARVLQTPPDVLSANAFHLDRTNDILYVAVSRRYDGQVLVFPGISTLSGQVAAAREMTINDGVRTLAMDTTRSMMYVGNAVNGVHVFTGIDTASGVVSASGHLLQAEDAAELALDAPRDRLYVASPFSGVRMVDGASTGSPAVVGPLPVPDASRMALDVVHDRLYVAGGERAYVLSGASGLTGSSPVPLPAVTTRSGYSISGFAFTP